MADLLSKVLPHLGAALVIASLLLSLTHRLTKPGPMHVAVFVLTFFVCLVPLPEHSVSHYARVLTGDLAVTSLIWLGFIAAKNLIGRERVRTDVELTMSLVILITALFLYPTALGFTPFDLYREGYQPLILGPIVLVLFAISVWFSCWLPSMMLLAGFVAYYFGCLESDNLWDYLIDPVITVYAVALVVIERRRINGLLKQSFASTLNQK